MTYRLQIRHNLEAAHRFYASHASPKCRSIHGHSWQVWLTLAAHQLDAQGMVIEFGLLKSAWRGWLDTHLDHSLMLHEKDPLAKAVQSLEPEARLFLLPVDPTTEHLAHYLYLQAKKLLQEMGYGGQVWVEGVQVQETGVNSVNYSP